MIRQGDASYYNVKVGGDVITDAAWYYPQAKEKAKDIEGYVAFYKVQLEPEKKTGQRLSTDCLMLWADQGQDPRVDPAASCRRVRNMPVNRFSSSTLPVAPETLLA